MAVTYAFTLDTRGDQRVGRQRVKTGVLTATGTYTTGGDAIAASLFGLSALDSLQINSATTGNTGQVEALVSRYNATTGELQHYWTGGAIGSELDEITAADDIGNFSLHVTARGI